MAKQLHKLTWEELEKQMSIAGEPSKVTALMRTMYNELVCELDWKNIPTLENAQFGLRKIISHLKATEKMQMEKQSCNT